MVELHLPLRIAVVGLGPMGMHHVRAVTDLVATKLVAVVDTRKDHAEEVARQFNSAAFTDVSHVMGAVDAAIIATPPDVHAATAVPLLNIGIPCLIEKPLALNEADCKTIMAAAAKTKAIVAVGHVERFNPAAEALLAENIPSAEISHIDVKRFSPAGGRAVATDVVSDMTIHDLDVVLALKDSDVVGVKASGAPDTHATAHLTFADGTTATIAADRKADTRVRALSLRTPRFEYMLDFMNRTVAKSASQSGAPQMLSVQSHDALRTEIADFLSSVTTKQHPRVTPEHALKSLHVAWRILGAIKDGSA
ncbi:MAG: Gfo/Idh/MocA family oxidoreductase [Rhodospirillaceae bacterium]|nr:Gfo/Idh/MocA family oxidoreductase [Rhodospirillaceae bacterium]